MRSALVASPRRSVLRQRINDRIKSAGRGFVPLITNVTALARRILLGGGMPVRLAGA